MAIVVVMAGGGTGGHVFPALALADTIREREPRARVHFIGTERGIERRLIPNAGYPLDLVAARPVLGKGPVDLTRAALDTVRGFFRARKLLRAARADLVIGLGAYASFPTVAAAASLGLPIGLLQMDAQPGLANRILGRFARGVFVQFAETARRFAPGLARVTGIPVRRMPDTATTVQRDSETEAGLVRLLVFGGSQGARSLNRAVLANLPSLDSRDGFRITHQTGSAELAAVRDAYQKAGVEADIEAFYDDMLERIAHSDLVVARAGISTIAELCAAGVASILVPHPHAAGHQAANARVLEQAGGCVVIRDSELEARLADEVRGLARDPVRRRRMGEAAAAQSRSDAADHIWSICASWLEPGPKGLELQQSRERHRS